MTTQYIYGFGGGKAEGRGDQKVLLGGKGAGLAEMSRLGVPVPPGFTITTEACQHYHRNGGAFPAGLREEFSRQLAQLETLQGRRFGNGEDPLLLSVRSGGPTSMPGMMDTVLNLGLNRQLIAAQVERGVDPRFLRDCYRRLLTMYGNVVLEVPHSAFERILAEARRKAEVATDYELSASDLEWVVDEFEATIGAAGKVVPESPEEQLWGAIAAVFDSWNNDRARAYRRLHRIPEDWGTGVNVQVMVFGNRGLDCATGVAFTRNPATGEHRVYGEYLINAQGEDVVAGIRTPVEIQPTDSAAGLGVDFPEAFAALQEICTRLEAHRHDMQDVEFTIENRELYMLQTRDGKRTGPAAVRIAVDMVGEGMIDSSEALKRVDPEQLAQLLAPEFDQVQKAAAVASGGLLAKGLAAGPGAASGRIALTAERATEMAVDGPVILVRDETSPEDIVGMDASAGILTARGGMTSHAAVVARGMGKPCIVGATELIVNAESGEVRAAGRVLREGDRLSIDGTTGEVIVGELSPEPSEVLQVLQGQLPLEESTSARAFQTVLAWADDARRLRVRTNADTPEDAAVARVLGAEGIGLCRTEHMFFAADRLGWIRQLILTDDDSLRRQALEQLLPVQQTDFEGILTAMAGLPVTIRLLDPPLHEFLPHDLQSRQRLADQMGVDLERIIERSEALAESNPMLGHRGCRLGLTTPSIYEMQVEAIARATVRLRRDGVDAQPEIMVPLVGVEEEMIRLRSMISGVLQRIEESEGIALEIPIGTMIEVPRAALVADKIAAMADFFSFGTNDMTQMTYGYSRDDVGRFLPHYLEAQIIPADPFARLDIEGVGQLVKLACERGRGVKNDLKIGICGEHGGDPSSVEFFDSIGLDYVSCSPYRVPVARLAAARSHLGHGAGGRETT